MFMQAFGNSDKNILLDFGADPNLDEIGPLPGGLTIMTYNVFGGTLNPTSESGSSINFSTFPSL